MSGSSNDRGGAKAGDSGWKIGRTVKERWLELLIALAIVAVLADVLLCSGDMFVTELKNWANTNQGFASIILSALLLFAYVLQFRTNDRQRVLMKQQKNIMTAGYTPVIGVLDQEVEDYTDEDAEQAAEKLILTIVNRGNSIAQDLEVRFEIAHDRNTNSIEPNTVPLRRVEEGTWWTSGSGGTLSHEEDETKFTAKVELSKELHGGYTVSKVAEELFDEAAENTVDRFSVITYLTYQDAMNNSEEIRLNRYNIANPPGDGTAKLANATEDAEN